VAQQYDNELTFVLFRNADKDPNNPAHEKWSDYKGEAQVGGVAYFADAWLNTARDGKKYLKGKLKPKQKQSGAAPAPAPADFQVDAPGAEFGDDIPF
jgi:hypothetical protein